MRQLIHLSVVHTTHEEFTAQIQIARTARRVEVDLFVV